MLQFRQDHLVDRDKDVIRFNAEDGERMVNCEISCELLKARFGSKGREHAEVAFLQNRQAIQHAASELYAQHLQPQTVRMYE